MDKRYRRRDRQGAWTWEAVFKTVIDNTDGQNQLRAQYQTLMLLQGSQGQL